MFVCMGACAGCSKDKQSESGSNFGCHTPKPGSLLYFASQALPRLPWWDPDPECRGPGDSSMLPPGPGV